VTVALSDGPPIRGRVLIVADGANSRTARLAYLEPAHEVGWGAQTRLAAPGLERGLDVVLGVGRTIRVATLARNGHQACLTLMTGDGSAAAQLADLCKAAAAAGLLPSGSGAAVTAAPNLGGAALELESHVGKRCLLVGDAGGFVSAFSHEGLYPALRSGWLAAESAARSLDAPVLQDELATFSSLWRTNLADYLHAPNTDLALLLPMVFSNLRMAQRLAQAFLLGQAL
jgi:flavin-dependent dehydrogenase